MPTSHKLCNALQSKAYWFMGILLRKQLLYSSKCLCLAIFAQSKIRTLIGVKRTLTTACITIVRSGQELAVNDLLIKITR